MSKYHYLTIADRLWIEELLKSGWSVKNIAESLAVSRATIYREIQRGMDSKQGLYHAKQGQVVYDNAIKRRGRKVQAPAGACAPERSA